MGDLGAAIVRPAVTSDGCAGSARHNKCEAWEIGSNDSPVEAIHPNGFRIPEQNLIETRFHMEGEPTK
jgi:hypothetical protein